METHTPDTRVALIGIIVEDNTVSHKINEILHDFSQYIIGRMGVPYAQKEISIISIIIDAPQDVINTLSGKLGLIKEVTVKTIYSKK